MTFEGVPIDKVAEYWDDRPCNIRHSSEPIGSLRYFREVRERKYRVEPHILCFADFPRWAGKRVLEIGCGIGTDTVEFAHCGADVVAVDVSATSIALARQRAKVYGVDDQIRFVLGSAEELSSLLLPQHFDLIYSFGVLHHTPHPQLAFAEIARVAGPDTAIKLMLYNRVSWKALALTHGRLWDSAAIALQSEAQTGCPVTYTYTPWGVRSMLSEWFDVERVAVDHIFPYKLDEYKRYEYKKHWWATLPGFRAVERTLGWHLLIDAKLKES